MAAAADARARRDEGALVAVLQAWLDEIEGVTLARLRSPRTRRGTKFWAPEPGVIEHKTADAPIETKAVDADYAVPGDRVAALDPRVRPVAVQIVHDAAAATAEHLGLGDSVVDHPSSHEGGMFAYDVAALDAAVEQAVAAMLGVGERHAEMLRRAITGADADAESLDEVLDAVAAAHRRGGGWVLLHGRTLANALRNRSEYDTARAVGVTHTQWLSRRDARVRAAHVHADGQVRAMGNAFAVGAFELEFPGDPKDLPASGPQVWGCRCSLIMAWPDRRTREALAAVEAAAADPEHSANLASQRAHFAATAPGVPLLDAIDAGVPPIPQITLDEPMIGYRVLPPGPEMAPGQTMTVTGPLVLALRAPRAAVGATVLGVSLPAGTVVGAAEGMLVLPAQGAAAGGAAGTTTLSVAAATSTSVTAVPVTGTAAAA